MIQQSQNCQDTTLLNEFLGGVGIYPARSSAAERGCLSTGYIPIPPPNEQKFN